MKKKKWVSYFIIALILTLTMAAAYSQEGVKYVQDPGFKKKTRPTPVFWHDVHNRKANIEDCGTCHHVYKDGVKVEGATSEDKKCSECHTIKRNPLLLASKYHLRCKGCHIKMKTGPVMCGECHVK